MYTPRHRERAIRYAEQNRRKRLQKRNEREKAKRGIDKFDVVLQSVISTAMVNERKYLLINQEKQPKQIIAHELNDSSIYYDQLELLENHSNIDDKSTFDSLDEPRTMEIDNDFHEYIYHEQLDEDPIQSNKHSDRHYNLLDTSLHNYTNVTTIDYCERLSSFLREADISKLHSTTLLKTIKSFLPVPNNVPATTDELLSLLNVEDLFTKQLLCIVCKEYLSDGSTSCSICQSSDKTTIAKVFDANIERILNKILCRLALDINDYKKQIDNNVDKEKTGDIPFRRLYQQLLQQNKNKNLISLLLHLDGVSLTKSTNVKLWLFSGSIVELPPKLRHRRYNMIPLSIWVGFREPEPEIWLKSVTNQLQYLKTKDIFVNNVTYILKIYGITGDCPALKKILNFVGHGGYDCCWFCYVHGEYINRKVQYCYQRHIKLRDKSTYSCESNIANREKRRINGHLGISILQSLLDVKLPHSIVIDYLHVTLLGHFKAIATTVYRMLTPLQRSILDNRLKAQKFPHFFNRKIRPFIEFAHIKSTELRNLFFYCILPNLHTFLPIEQVGHLALYVCAIRLLHGPSIFGDETSAAADILLSRFHKDHDRFYDDMNNYVLHLHSHLPTTYEDHGALSSIGCFGQEDFIGNISSHHHGTGYYGESIAYYYNIDFSLHNRKKTMTTADGPIDRTNEQADKYEEAHRFHSLQCNQCEQRKSCISIYRRFKINDRVFHSLIYERRQQSVSYFVRYLFNDGQRQERFGIIKFFFTYRNQGYAVMQHHPIKHLYSNIFRNSAYYDLLKDSLDGLFFLLEKYSHTTDIVHCESILEHCIVIEMKCSLFVTPISSYHEHD